MIVKQEKEFKENYIRDESNIKGEIPEKVFLPENTCEIAQILKEAYEKEIPVWISGGGTGIVGGRCPGDKGWVISTELLNKIEEVDFNQKWAVLQAGVRIDEFLNEISKYRLFYPPFPTEKTAFIGGNVATNASGEYSYKFGCTRNYILELEVVLSNGSILHIERGERIFNNGYISFPEIGGSIFTTFRSPNVHKNSCGYYIKDKTDAIDIFIGSEGTLGVVSKAKVKLIDAPDNISFIVMFLEKVDIIKMVKQLRNSSFSKNIFSIEYFDKNSLDILKEYYSIPSRSTEAVFIILSNWEENLEKLDDLISEFHVIDTWIGDSLKEQERLYNFRKKLPEAINELVRHLRIQKISTDIAIPYEYEEKMFSFYKEISGSINIKNVLFGHIGESHLHMNLLPSYSQIEEAHNVYLQLLKKGVELGGTISAEHGIGKKKKMYLPLMFSTSQLNEMKKIKKCLDPKFILSKDNLF